MPLAKLICSWCGKEAKVKVNTGTGQDSHGICPKCMKEQTGQEHPELEKWR